MSYDPDSERPRIRHPDGNDNVTGWFVGIIVALALLAIGYLVFSANSTPSIPAAPPAASDTVKTQ